MVRIEEVKTKKQIKEFLNFQLKMYKGNPYYVPPLYSDEVKLFNGKFVYYEQADAKWFLAYKDGKVAGRVGAVHQKASNEKWNQKRVRFTRFDCIDDQEVVTGLLKAVEDYAKELGMEEVVGPLGFSDMEREGLLIEGFDYLNTFEEQYNFPYYQKLIEGAGYNKEHDWIEARLFAIPDSYQHIQELSDRMLKRFNLRLVEEKSSKKFMKVWGEKVFDLWQQTYSGIYGTCPITPNIRKDILGGFGLLINMNFAKIVVDENDNIVAFGLAFPGIGHTLQRTSGHLTPITALRLLWNVKHPKYVDFALVGVVDKYKQLGVVSALTANFIKSMLDHNVKYCESNLCLEYNIPILAQFKNFDAMYHKKRRCFIKKV